MCVCVHGGLYDNNFPCSHPTVIIDKTLAQLTPTGSMGSENVTSGGEDVASGGEDCVNSTMWEKDRKEMAV